MPVITLRDVRVRFRGPPLLDGVSCHVEAGQRIGLLGRNGAGKTTLMRLVAGDLEPDGGEIVLAPGTRVAMLRQDVPQDVAGTIADVVASGLDADAPPPAADVRRHVAVSLVLSVPI
jgi:ATP-binding cassette subfamily F protein uup